MGYFAGRFAWEGIGAVLKLIMVLLGFLVLSALALAVLPLLGAAVVMMKLWDIYQKRRITNGNG